jgi:hypothetical protein
MVLRRSLNLNLTHYPDSFSLGQDYNMRWQGQKLRGALLPAGNHTKINAFKGLGRKNAGDL